MPTAILSISREHGGFPHPLEQLDGSLLIPPEARPLLAQALALAGEAVGASEPAGAAVRLAQAMLGLPPPQPQPQDGAAANLLKVRPI